MILKIAWKNIWRNPLRSFLVMMSIIVGVWAAAFILSFVFAIIDNRMEDAIGYEVSHLQFHHPDFDKDNEPQYVIPGSPLLLESLSADNRIEALSGRLISYGMVASSRTSSGGKFIGIDPAREDAVTKLNSRIIEGEYLNADDRNKIIIGRKLANKLKVKLRSKIVLTFQDKSKDIVAGAFRIKGIFEGPNTIIEENNLYMRQQDLDALLQTEGDVHEIAMLLKDADSVEEFVLDQRVEYPELLIESWRELAPEISLIVDSIDEYMLIFLAIILLAISFGIVNTMLMAVLERVREIGVLMSIGMNNVRLFTMIFLETILIVVLASPIGLLLAYGTISYYGNNGLDTSGLYKEGYETFGFDPMVHLSLDTEYYWKILLLVGITAILASIYPAISAIRLDPVKAIRKI